VNSDDLAIHTSPKLKSSSLWKIRGKAGWAYVSDGKSFHYSPLWIRYAQPDEYQGDPVRLACAVSRKYGNAVKRNKFKRRVKDVVRKNTLESELGGLVLLVGISNKAQEEVSYSRVQEAISAFVSSLK
jgi:ribonuclease P protein component